MRGPRGGPNCMWIGSAVSMQLSRESTYTLQWGWICPPKLPLPLGDPPNVWLLAPTRVHNPSGISIGSAIFAGLTVVSNRQTHRQTMIHTHTHTRLTALFPGLPRWAGTRKVKPISILLKQDTVSGSGISWAICMSAPHSRQITTPAPHHSVFTGQMPFLLPNQLRQSTEGTRQKAQYIDSNRPHLMLCIALRPNNNNAR